ncbi:MAG: hypothetical protein SFY80_15215 [Verrucomicrobiota bacterium]|nr:hypothetical protein [Verrucomicrobiota bacterium]
MFYFTRITEGTNGNWSLVADPAFDIIDRIDAFYMTDYVHTHPVSDKVGMSEQDRTVAKGHNIAAVMYKYSNGIVNQYKYDASTGKEAYGFPFVGDRTYNTSIGNMYPTEYELNALKAK